MEAETWLIFIAVVFIGSYLQSVIGFGMALIVVAIARISGGVDFATLTAAISLIALVNIVVALRGNLHFISRNILALLILGQLPAVALGLFALHHLSISAVAILEALLAIFLICGSVASVYRPRPFNQVSGLPALLMVGAIAGLCGGLFAASGPVMGWFGYRQPLQLAIIRATLLAFFAVGCLSRTLMVGYSGGLTGEVMGLFVASMPATILGAWLGLVAKPPVTDVALKKIVFVALILMGTYIGIRAASQLGYGFNW